MKRAYFAMLSILLAIGVCIVVSFGWFTNTEFVEPDLSGYSISAYFAGGTGAQDDPFQIKTSRHLYNLAWLQYLGYFNKPGSGNVRNDNDTEHMTQYSFVIEEDLDMEGWPLPPIGTTYRPFIGVLNGNGHKIENLVTSNNFSDFEDDATNMHKHPSTIDSSAKYINAEVIGFIGVIGKTSDTGINTIDTSEKPMELNQGLTVEPKVTNIILVGNEVKSSTNNVLIGSVAGYVNGKITNVGVKDPTLKVNSSAVVQSINNKIKNFSDYSVVGYAEDKYTTFKTNNNTTIYNPTTTYNHFTYYGMGDYNEWGGSIDMNGLYNRILNKVPASSGASTTYINNELQYINNSSKANKALYATANQVVSNLSNDSTGNYSKVNRTNTERFQYLNALYKNVIEVTKTDEIANGELISSNGNYLNLKSTYVDNTLNFNVSIDNGTNSSLATTWIADENYHLFTYNEDDGYAWYLVGNNDLSITITNNVSNASQWYWDSNYNTYYTRINSTDYYLKFFNESWTLKNTYIISDGNDNYLKYSNSTISNTKIKSDASYVMFTTDGTYPSGKIYFDNGYYLRQNNGTLNVASTDSNNQWTNSNGTLYITYSGNSYSLTYTSSDNSWKLLQENSFYVKYDSHYLKNDLSDVTKSNATAWTHSNNKFYYVDNGQTYYLRFNNDTTNKLEVSTVDSNNTWNNDDYGYYYSSNDNKYYLQYDDGWKAMELTLLGYKISRNNNYYTLNTQAGNFDLFNFDSNGMYTTYQGTKIYINVTYTTTWFIITIYSYKLGTTNASGSYILKRNNNTIRAESVPSSGGTTSVYLYYNNGWSASTSSQSLDIIPQYSYTSAILETTIEPLSIAKENTPTIKTSNQINVITRSDVIIKPSVFNYIPLNMDNNNVSSKNTGYIIAGSYDRNTIPTVSNQYSDIRISEYYFDQNINTGILNLKDSGAFSSFNSDTVRTKDTGGIHYINDTSNSYAKYKASKQNLIDTWTTANSSSLYGLHFMNASISKARLVTAPSVSINGKTETNYQMPEDCIDFQLASNGYINFFAGTYFPGNNSFFSLHEIKRNGDKEITAINHIVAIYQNKNNLAADYVYQYSNGTYSSAQYNSTDYELIFDCMWIEQPGTAEQIGYKDVNDVYKGDIFYFEIPVNKGEFALGSVDGRTGAYLFYLDIGANAAPVDRTIITQENKTVKSDYKYANGIQLIATTTVDSIDASNSAVATIPVITGLEDYKTFTVTRTGDNITFTNYSNNSTVFKSTYKGNVNITGVTLDSITTPVTIVEKVLKYIDYNKVTKSLYETTVINDGENNTGYTVYRVGDNSKTLIADQTTSDTAAKDLEYGLLEINANGAGQRVTNYTSVAVNTSEARTDLNYEFLVDTANKNDITTTVVLDYERITGTGEITNYDTSINNAPATISYTDGKISLSGYSADFVYKLTGDTITVTLNATTQVKIKINESRNYTFIINGTTATTSSDNIYTQASTSNG